MHKIVKTFNSPYFKDQKRKLVIWEPNNITKDTPVLFFYDGQVLKTKEKEFTLSDGIDIFKHLKQIGDFIIIGVNSMNEDSKIKYRERSKELLNLQDSKYIWMELIKKEIKELQKTYLGQWFGFGFSLSGFLIGQQEKLFDQTILISPYFKNHVIPLPKNSIVFYGKKEYEKNSEEKINKPIQRIARINKNINFIEIKKMIHDFYSWNDYFLFILKASVKSFLEFAKYEIEGVGKFNKGNSNISYMNQGKHLKIKANNIDNTGLEEHFIKHTQYKDDYDFIDNTTFMKTLYLGEVKKTLNKQDIIHLAQELRVLHSISICSKMPTYKNIPFKDELVMTHGDLNHKNILFNKDKAIFIDFEWSRLNSRYWDICSIIYFFELNGLEQKLLFKTYKLEADQEKLQLMSKHLKEVIEEFDEKHSDYFISD